MRVFNRVERAEWDTAHKAWAEADMALHMLRRSERGTEKEAMLRAQWVATEATLHRLATSKVI